MADTVDDARREERNPRHLHGPDRQADETEQREIDDHHGRDAGDGVRRVYVTLHPVVGRALAESFERFGIFRFQLVQIGALPHHLSDAEHDRAVRIVGRFAARVVLAVNSGPLLGLHAGGQP